MTWLDELRDAERRWSADDDRWWAEVLGLVFAVGLYLRATTHVLTALVAGDVLDEDINPRLADTDVTLASPVTGLRGHRVDRAARFATLVVGLGAWLYLTPLTGGTAPIAAFTVAQLAVCLLDPVAFVAWQARDGGDHAHEHPQRTNTGD